MTVKWSRPQENVLASPFDAVICERRHGIRTRLEMASVSCSDTSQSEAFVSTVALFVIFALSPREEKAHLRLPPAWRDLWAEMVQKKKDGDDNSDRQDLRELRNLIAWSRLTDTQPIVQSTGKTTVTKPDSIADSSTTKEGLVSSAAMKAIWNQKSSTPSYHGMLRARTTLPIWQYRHEILDAIEDHQVVIVCGQTGCGKSTQVPAYILENELSNGRSCKIYCTEPRRISAISLARRVSEELGESKADVGTSRSMVGFAIRLESQVTPHTRLVYATTGIVMRMLEGSGDLDGVTHLLLDEVHERRLCSWQFETSTDMW